MSSNSGNRKSMDDVLSSIRRIIGNEGEEPAASPRGDGGIGRDVSPPLNLGAPISAPEPSDAAPPDPLSLTPNMRVDFSQLKEDGSTEPPAPAQPRPEALSDTPPMRATPSAEPEEGSVDARAEPQPPTPESFADAPYETAPYETAEHDEEDALLIDEAALEEMIRRVVREELDIREAARPPVAPVSEADMRRVVQEELMGDVGQNISRNVQALIKAEVAKLKQG